MATTESGELEKYRKYIQKRRVSPPEKDSTMAESSDNDTPGTTQSKHEDEGESETPWWEKEAYTLLDKDDLIASPGEYKMSNPSRMDYKTSSSTLPVIHRKDSSLYKKLYAQSGYRPSTYKASYKNSSSSRTQIEDNRATLMAIKLIKQALACFAILGIIVLMQSRSDMQEVLAVVRKHVVETHIEPQSLFEGVKSVFSQLVQAVGGSP